MSSRRLARQRAIAPTQEGAADPNRVYQKTLDTPWGDVRAWFRAGVCYRVNIAGRPYGWGEGPAVWAALQDGTFRPSDFGKHNERPY